MGGTEFSGRCPSCGVPVELARMSQRGGKRCRESASRGERLVRWPLSWFSENEKAIGWRRAMFDRFTVAEALERIARSSVSPEEQPLFTRWRDPAIVRLAAEKDAAAKAEFEQVEVRGGCWYLLKGQPPCKEEGKEDGYAWKGACYTPSYPAQRQPTADPP